MHRQTLTWAAVLLTLVAAATKAPRPAWTRYVIFANGADYAVDPLSPEAFILRATRTDETVPKTGALAIANIDREMWTHNKVALSLRSLNGKRVDVNVALSYIATGGKVEMKTGGGLQVAGRAWRDVVLSLDQDFGLGDRSVMIKQAKIGAWVGHWKRGESGGIEVKDFRLCGPNEVSVPAAYGPKDTFRSVPSAGWRLFGPAPRPDALKVFFAFDNEDVIESISTRKKGLRDLPQFGGFRAILFEHLDGQAQYVTDLADADLIVYSRCRPDRQLAKEISTAVRERGVPLYAASEVCDPEIEALLPCSIGHEPPEDLPPRARVAAADAAHPLARGDFTDAPFGIYRTVSPRDGSRTILAYANGVPALMEGTAGKGKVLYSMLAIGSSLVPGKESPDAFFVRALGYLSGRTLPERARAKAGPDANGWYDGVGKGSFGRFGWETGSGLLVGRIGTRFTVTNGDAAYDFGFPRTPEEEERGRAFTFAGDRVNQLSLGGELAIDRKPAARIDMSLGYPGVRWEFRRPRVELYLKNLLSRAAVPLQDGVKVLDLANGASIPPGGWTQPWLLLFNASENDTPLLLVFQHRLEALDIMRSGEALRGLVLDRGQKNIGMVTPAWIFGGKPIDTTGWDTTLPPDALARIRLWHPRALRYPVDCTEHFRLRTDKGRVVIRSTYAYAEADDDWHTSAVPYAPVPPVAYMLRDTTPDGEDAPIFVAERGVEPRGLVTYFGDFADKDGASHVQWALPLLSPDLGFLPHARGYPQYERIANEQFASGVRFTCGGGVKVDYVKDKGGSIRNPDIHNLSMHSCLHGMCRCTPNPFIYSEENRRLMRRRLTWRMLEPLETMPYKMACRWRREPVSGSVYTIYMNSPRDISTVYAPETYGSKIIYGDSNETVRMILACLQVLEDRMGQHGLAKANWDAVSRHVASYEMCIDDWCYLASGCLEYGGPGSIDMLNSEFSCMMKLARLAEIAGDEELRAQALYRAARRLCPTLARLKMRNYFARNGLLPNPEKVRASIGYNEQGAIFQPRGRRVRDIDLFDMSQGIPQDLIALYRWHGWKELRADYLSDARTATVADGLDYIITAILAIGDNLPDGELAAKLAACAADEDLNKRLPRDWPGMDTGSYMEYTLARLAGSPRVSDCRQANVHDARWDPSARKLTLDYTPGANARLSVTSGARTIALPTVPVGVRRTETLDL